MAEQEDDDLRIALGMSMQNSPNSPPEPKRSKPRDIPIGTLEEESPDIKSRRLQRELLAAAAEKRMLASKKDSPLPGSTVSPSGTGLNSGSTPEAVKKVLSFEEVNLGTELTEAEAMQLFTMVFGNEVSKGILARWSNQGIRCVSICTLRF